MSGRSFDVLVIGGGLAGLAFASLLRAATKPTRPELSIGILEQAPPGPGPSPGEIGLRVLAIAPGSREILARCEAWSRLPADRIGPYRRMQVWRAGTAPDGPMSLAFDAAEAGEAELGYILESDVIRRALWAAVESTGAAEFLLGAAPEFLEQDGAGPVLRLAGGERVRARLLVGADGASSWLRNALKLATSGHAYGQRALVAHVASERPHGQAAWQCFRQGGPVALLPLPDGRSSIVWSCPEAEAERLLAGDEAQFADELTAATESVLGRLTLTTRRLAFPLATRHAHRYAGEGFALVGDAIHQVHPLAGQGINLGFQDSAALAEVLAAHLAAGRHADPGDLSVLRRYERWRKGANLLTLGAMEGLHRLFTSPLPAVPAVGGYGLGLVDRLPAVKRLLARHALGRAGRLPAAARPSID